MRPQRHPPRWGCCFQTESPAALMGAAAVGTMVTISAWLCMRFRRKGLSNRQPRSGPSQSLPPAWGRLNSVAAACRLAYSSSGGKSGMNPGGAAGTSSGLPGSV